MKCEDIQIGLSEFIDNELHFKNSQIIKEHIGGCKLCFREVENIRRLKKQLVSFEASLCSDFDLKLQQRINEANKRSLFRKALPLAASIALVVPLVDYLAFQAPVAVQHDFIIELQSIGKMTLNDNDNENENFHKWTQLNDSKESLECSGSISGSYCSLDLLYFPQA